jgi:arylformamidase
MILTLEWNGERMECDLRSPIDISIPLSPLGPRAWYVAPMRIAPEIQVAFAGSVWLGGSVNFNNVQFNPHGHGTHTESVGHITKEPHSMSTLLGRTHFIAALVSVSPEVVTEQGAAWKPGDRWITRKQLEQCWPGDGTEALVVRTLPNHSDKLHANYSNTNFPFFEPSALAFLNEKGVKHLLTDLPSVDREEDGGKLLAHRAFWAKEDGWRLDATITEMIYVHDNVSDGLYILDLQTASIENDATPSRPLLYNCTSKK